MNVFAAVLEDFHKLDNIELWRLTELTSQSWALCRSDWTALRLCLLWAHCLFDVPCRATASQPGKAVWAWGSLTGKAHGSWLTSAATAAFRADSSDSAERKYSNLLQIDVSWLCQSFYADANGFAAENNWKLFGCVCRALNASWWMPRFSFGLYGWPSVAKLISTNSVDSTIGVAEHPVPSLLYSSGFTLE